MGPGLLLIHGGLQTAGAFLKLNELLSDRFTVYRVERRGRPPSGGYGDSYGMMREIEDVRAIVEETGTQYVFGLSVGALIVLSAARAIPAITKIALYEPPLAIAGAADSPIACIPAFGRALSAGNKGRAVAVLLKGIDDPSLMTKVPTSLLGLAFGCILGAKPPGSHIPMGDLIATVHYDMVLAQEMAGTMDGFRTLETETLLLRGDRSRPFSDPL